uniref:Glycosyltransferase n=1 Tax=Loa loa TaxID=7209 RepID=A0A1I7W013_LOALO
MKNVIHSASKINEGLYRIFNIQWDKLKLLIVISNDDEGAKSEALNAVEEIRKQVVSAPICVVAQSDNRDNK